MSESLDRRAGSNRRVEPEDRLATRPDSHVGSPRDYVARLQAAAKQAAFGFKTETYRNHLLTWMTQESVLYAAYRQLQQYGGWAPGVDGLTYGDIPLSRLWSELRRIRDDIRDGKYQASPHRVVEILKLTEGTRQLQLPTIWDRTVGKAIALAIEPYFEVQFDERSFGFRPQRGCLSAIAHAVKLAEAESLFVWAVVDVRNAFGTIPRGRLLEILASHIGNGLIEIVGQLVDNGQGRGIPQGQPLCPLLLNVYANHVLDDWVRQLLPRVRMVRYADDLLLLCKSVEEARKAIETIKQILLPHGWQIKDKDQVCDLLKGNYVDYMGVRVSYDQGRWDFRLASTSWKKLEQTLVRTHLEPEAPITAYHSVLGWLQQKGFLIGNETTGMVLDRLGEIAQAQGFDELPDRSQMLETIQASQKQWLHTLRVEEAIIGRLGCACSAPAHVFSRPAGRSESCRSVPPAGFFVLYTDGACQNNGTPDALGGWAYLLECHCNGRVTWHEGSYGGFPQSTNNQMELEAVFRGLCRVPDNAMVTVVSDSRYVVDMANQNVARWAREDYFSQPRRDPNLKNEFRWAQITEQARRLNCSFEWVEGHAGHPANEWCDRMAVHAAHQVARQGAYWVRT